MAKDRNSSHSATSDGLRTLAEERLKKNNVFDQAAALSPTSSPVEMIRLIHELQIHQVELEMQQEELARTRMELEESLGKYTELYDFAPTPYVTLGRDTVILEANLAATKLLYVDRSRLQGMRFKQFIVPEDYKVIDAMLDNIFTNRVAGNCELRLLANAPHPTTSKTQPSRSGRPVRLEAAVSDSEYACRIIISDITPQKAAEEGLRKSERITDHIEEVVVVADGKGVITNVSPISEAMFGFPCDEVIGHSFIDYMAEDDVPDALKVLNETLLNKTAKQVVKFKLKRKNGSVFDSEIHLLYYQDEEQIGFVCLIWDITEQKNAENELQRLNRALKATNSCNLALIHATDEMQLLQTICSIMVDIGGYRMAWIGYAEHDKAKSIRPVAQAGFEQGYLKLSSFSWADVPLGQGPTGTAIRTAQPFSISDIQKDPKFEPWRHEASKRGYASIQCLPMKMGNEVFGAITIYSELKNDCNAEETKLLTALADNLAYGITMLRNRKAKQQAVDELKQSEERFRKLFEGHASIMLIIDPDTGAIIDANPSAEVFYGWSIQDIRRMHIQDINTQPSETVKNNLETLKSSKQNKFLVSHRRANGTTREVEIVSNLISIEGKELIYSIINDITERKQQEHALKKSEERFRTLFESHCAVMMLLDPDTGNIIDANSAASKFYGWSIEKLRTMKIQQITTVPPEEVKSTMEKIQASKQNEFLFRHKKEDGSVHNVEVFSTPVEIDGKSILYEIIHDITERIQAAEESDRLKTAFLANISHEIRTPMNGILGFSELLTDPHLTGEEQAEYRDLIHRSGKRMLNLITDLMDISKIEAKVIKLVESETLINHLLRDLLAFSKLEADQKGLRLSCTTALSDNESIITTDEGKLTQILTNLIQNAIKFTSKGGIDFGYTLKGTMLEFYVIDSGRGISADIKEKIFERFHQADISLTRAHEGSGLGLSISKAFIELLGGTIHVESVEGAGSTFTFTLPYKPNHPHVILSAAKDPSPLTAITNAHTILIAEDDAMSTILLQKSLKSENITILCAENGWEAVELVRHHPEIKLVLMDLKMPIMNGYDATKLIKQHCPDLPVIAQSAFSSKEDKEKASEAGCDSFITKPISKTELLKMMQVLLHP